MEFKGILRLLIVSETLSIITVGSSYILGNNQVDMEKVSIDECWFDPFDNPGNPLSVRFVLIGFLYVIFDL